MKNIQIIDGAENCTYEVYAATDDEFKAIFTQPGQDIEFIEELDGREDPDYLDRIFENIWQRRQDKKKINGIHGTIFYEMSHKKIYFPTKKESEAVTGIPRLQR